MKWDKLGQIYQPQLTHPKLISHAANPLPVHLIDDVFRIYYSGRDNQNRSSVSYVDIDIIKREVVYIHNEPVFEFGSASSFYSHGVSIGNCYQVGHNKYMLFMGWKCPEGGHWFGQVGRLKVNDDFSLILDTDEPLLALDSMDDISISYPWVTQLQGKYLMWYGTTSSWDAGNHEMLHTLNFATSQDGSKWEKHGLAIPYELGVAQAFSRPTVFLNEVGCHMWFSYRSGAGQTYRIGYAYRDLTKLCAQQWTLDLNAAGIDVSDSGWDSEMIEYPFVFEHKQQVYMLYNGNGYGASGFGLAALRST